MSTSVISPGSAIANVPLFVVSYGKSGGLGCFAAPAETEMRRGARVVLETVRGLEVGTVLCCASPSQARLLGSVAGKLLRGLDDDDQSRIETQQRLGQELFERARSEAVRLGLPLEILDVEVLFDGREALVQFVGAEDTDVAALVTSLTETFALGVHLENLSGPSPHHEDEHGCDKPDCGRKAGGSGGCTSCSTGGGCSSCGTGKVDMKAYFGHLRTKMESQRTPLL